MGFKERAKERAKAVAAGDSFKLKEDDNFIRVLPTPESEDGAGDDGFYDILMHSDVGPDKRFLRCGKDAVTREGECYICDKVIARLVAQGNSESAQKLKPRWNAVFQVLTIDDNNKWQGPFVWKVGGKLGQNLLTVLGSGKRDYTHPTKGYNFTINRSGTGLKTEYSAPIPDDDPSSVPQKYVDMLKPFVQLAEIPTYSEQAQRDAIRGVKSEPGAGDRDDRRGRRGALDDDEDEQPRRKRPPVEDDDEPAPRSRKPAPVEDDEDEPAPRKPKKPAVDPDDAEDEPAPRKAKPAPVDDDDEEPRPVRTTKPKAAPVEADEDEDTPPPAKPKVKVSRAAVEPEEDEEAPKPKAKRPPVVEPDDADDEEPAPKPAKSAAKKAAAAADDDDGEDAPKPTRAPNGKRAAPAPPVDDDEDDPFGDD